MFNQKIYTYNHKGIIPCGYMGYGVLLIVLQADCGITEHSLSKLDIKHKDFLVNNRNFRLDPIQHA